MIRILKDKRLISVLAGLIIFAVGSAYGVHLLSSGKSELSLLKEQRKEMFLLKGDYLAGRHRVDAVENKKSLSGSQGVAQAVDEVFLSIGLKDKLKTLKSTGKREVTEGFEEDADLYVEKVTMNEMVNIFYKIQSAPMILSVKRVTVKKAFDNHELLNISLGISFLKTK
ncbi:MAG: hypothetical protein AB1442_16565 [Nitrospirota bacterium]